MATNLKIAFPDIPFNAVSVISSETYSADKPLANLITGSRSTYAELASELIGQHEIEFDLGSGVSQACDYLALVNANVLKKSGVDYVRLRGSEVSYQYPTSMLAICDPERDVTFDSANRVSQVTDQSGNSNHFTQSTDALKPLITRADNYENLFQYSEQIDNAYWTKYSSSASANSIANPIDGLITADTLIENTSVGDWHRLQRLTTFVIGKTYRLSGYFKQASGTRHLAIWFRGAAFPSDNIAYFNLTTGVVHSNTTTSATIESLGNGWYRCTATQLAAATSTNSQANFHIVATLGGVAYTGDGTSSLYVFGLQMQDSSASTTYLQTTSLEQIAGINGNRCLAFDGTNDYLLANGIATALSGDDVPFTLVTVLKSNNVTALQGIACLFKTTDSSIYNLIWQQPSSPRYFIQRRGTSDAGSVSINGTTPDTNTNILSFTFTGTTAQIHLNRTQIASGALNSGVLTAINGFIVGARQYGASPEASSYWNGKIAFMAVASSALGTSDREAWEDYLTNRYTVAPIADIDLQNATLTGAKGKDYITTFTESAAYRYWIPQFITNTTSSKRRLSKLYFGKLFDLGRDPQLGAQVESKYHQDKGIHEKRSFSLNYKGISTSKRQDFEDKIGNKKDVNHVMLHTTTYDTPLLTTDLTSGEIKSAKFESNGAQQNDLSIKIDETY